MIIKQHDNKKHISVFIEKTCHHDRMNKGMENAWEPMKNRNSLAVSERLWRVVGTTSHMLGKKRKGPQLTDGWILGWKNRCL